MKEMIPKKIGKIDFALMGPKEVRKLSATKVITVVTLKYVPGSITTVPEFSKPTDTP